MKHAAAALAGLAVLVLTASAAADVAPSPPPKLTPLPQTHAAQTHAGRGAGGTLTVRVSSHRARARRVVLTLGYSAMLQCGRPRGSATIRLPASARVPAKIRVADVKMNGRAVGSVVVRNHVLRVTAPRVHGMICDSLTEGKVTLVFAAAARLANPAKAGTYTVAVESAGATLSGTYSVS